MKLIKEQRERILKLREEFDNGILTPKGEADYLDKLSRILESEKVELPPKMQFSPEIDAWDVAVHLNQVLRYLAAQKKDNTCPPHNLIDFTYQGAWSGLVPPPNKKCTKCLLEMRF